MAIIVEDGTGLATAESYISVADADTYFSKRGNATWSALTTAQKEEALRKAADYMQAVYYNRWSGTRVNGVQALDWPRSFVVRTDYEYAGMNGSTFIGGNLYYPSDEVPDAVKRGQCELAVRASSADLLADQGRQIKTRTVGPISTTYTDGARQATRYALVEGMLQPFFGRGSSQLSVTRA